MLNAIQIIGAANGAMSTNISSKLMQCDVELTCDRTSRNIYRSLVNILYNSVSLHSSPAGESVTLFDEVLKMHTSASIQLVTETAK